VARYLFHSRRSRLAAPCVRLDIEGGQIGGAFPKAGFDLEDDAILIEPGENRSDLPLPERTVKCVVDRLQRDTEQSCSITMNDK
jgi:hypothetical protein